MHFLVNIFTVFGPTILLKKTQLHPVSLKKVSEDVNMPENVSQNGIKTD
jgi:hypothetical protein